MSTQTAEAVANELPLYRCHKEVRAARILGIQREPDHTVLLLEGIGPVSVPKTYMDRNPVHIDGYLVAYKDGWLSFSPRGAFEEGYTRI